MFRLESAVGWVHGTAPPCTVQPRLLDSLGAPAGSQWTGSSLLSRQRSLTVSPDSIDPHSIHGLWHHYCRPCGIHDTKSGEPRCAICASVEAFQAGASLGVAGLRGSVMGPVDHQKQDICRAQLGAL
ncbi:hypothetical protein NDU88_000179 [Pleurodeles waltl]|uniref:Uncharacterized protein n=1 Tax=Pleurodeles waltl TaxID=8319 RepID=A0AAV7PZG5_PLEWA|nr:hypothetical protein NDU88_000179 [Pleurodeles waltl]